MPSTAIYTLSLHDALPILRTAASAAVRGRSPRASPARGSRATARPRCPLRRAPDGRAPRRTRRRRARDAHAAVRAGAGSASRPDRKSTRLNSSHSQISYAVHRDLHSFPTRRSSDLTNSSQRSRSGSLTSSVAGARLASDGAPSLPSPSSARRSSSATYAATSCARRTRRGTRRRRLGITARSEEHTSELQSQSNLVCRPPRSTLFPYTTLFRSYEQQPAQPFGVAHLERRRREARERRRALAALSVERPTVELRDVRGDVVRETHTPRYAPAQARHHGQIGRAHV